MIPYTYHMVDMEGIDLADVSGEVFSGLYSKIEDALDDTMVLVLYDWFIAGVKIAPSYVKITQESGKLIINELVEINSDDTISIPGMSSSPVISSLTVEENGTYIAPSGTDGYSPVSVAVPQQQPVIESLSVTENGTYAAPSGTDGYSPVSVAVPQQQPVIESLSVTENGTYAAPSGTDGYSPVSVNVPQQQPVIESLSVTQNGTYTPPSGVDGYGPVTVNVSGIGSVNLHLGRLKIDTGEITESDEYYYSDLIPITGGSGYWFIDLTRSDVNSYYIGISFFAQDGTTNTGYIRQYATYRSYSANISSNSRYFRIALKVSELSTASALYTVEKIFVGGSYNDYKLNV